MKSTMITYEKKNTNWIRRLQCLNKQPIKCFCCTFKKVTLACYISYRQFNREGNLTKRICWINRAFVVINKAKCSQYVMFRCLLHNVWTGLSWAEISRRKLTGYRSLSVLSVSANSYHFNFHYYYYCLSLPFAYLLWIFIVS